MTDSPLSPPQPMFEQDWPEGDFRFFQLGFVVADLLSSAHRWARVFGVGPFHVLPRMDVECSYRGTQSGLTMQVAVAQAGPVQIELIQQHCDRPSIYDEASGEGECLLHQLCTVTSDYDGRTTYYQDLGYGLVSEIHGPAGRVSFFDTVADFGFFIEVVEGSADFLASLAAIARTCADWDGTDPVRVLTRDGYRIPDVDPTNSHPA